MSDETLPLAGIRILAFENFGAGPFGSMYLADLGAEIIKIENRAAGGDATRQMGPYFLGDDDSLFFQTFNTNKKSVTLDVKHPHGRAVFRRLAATADAVLNNLRGDQPAKLGITYPDLREVNPRIVCAHLSAYGRDNERTSWPGYDYLMQAEAGYFHLTGEPGSPPARMGLSIVDYMSGITLSVALLAALLSAGKTGRGRDVDVSLFDVALHQLSYPATWYLNEKLDTRRLPRSSHPSAVPVQTFQTADGWIFVMCMMEKFWLELLRAMDRLDLAADRRFANMNARREFRDQLTSVLDAEFGLASTQEWLRRLEGRLPVAPILDLPQALENHFVRDVGMVRVTEHPRKRNLRTLVNPIKLDGQRLPGKVCSGLGADNEAVLGEIGIGAEECAQLRLEGVL